MHWRDALSELIRYGYSVRASGENLHIKWQGSGTIPKEKLSALIAILKEHKQKIFDDPSFIIDETLREINEAWEPKFFNYLKFSSPRKLDKLLNLEEKINQCALKHDLSGLKKSLNEYRELVKGISKEFGVTDIKQKELFFQQNACRQ